MQLRRVRTILTGVAGTPWYQNFYFTWVTGTESTAVANVGHFWASVDNHMKTGISWATEANVAVIEDTTDKIVSMETVTPWTNAGAAAANLLPPANQGLVQWHTDVYVNGRQLRGRTFLPGLTEDVCSPTGIWEATPKAQILAAAQLLISESSSSGPLRVYSPTHAQSAVVKRTVVPDKFAVLRSRRD